MIDLIIQGDPTGQYQKDILELCKGHLKHAPTLGVCVIDYIDDEAKYSDLRYAIRQNFAADGMTVDKIVIEDKKITIDASY